MKTILIATDFSKASNNALLHAAEYAKAFKANLVVYHVFRIIHSNPGIPPAVLQQNYKEGLQDRVNKLQRSSETSIEVIVEDAINIADAILHVAKEKEAAIIFLGMKKRGSMMRKLFGSTAAKLSHQSIVPLIIVPEDAAVALPKSIVLANDLSDQTDMTILYPLSEVVQTFQSKLFIARIVKSVESEHVEKVTASKISSHLADIQWQMVYIWDDNVYHGLNELLREKKADMIAMIPHHHSFLEKLLEGSKTDHMLFHSKIPVMVLPDRITLVPAKPKIYFKERDYAIE